MSMMTKKDVAAELKCSVRKVEKMMAAGEIRYRKIGTLVRFQPSEVDRIAGTPQPHGFELVPQNQPTVIEKTRACEPVRGRS